MTAEIPILLPVLGVALVFVVLIVIAIALFITKMM